MLPNYRTICILSYIYLVPFLVSLKTMIQNHKLTKVIPSVSKIIFAVRNTSYVKCFHILKWPCAFNFDNTEKGFPNINSLNIDFFFPKKKKQLQTLTIIYPVTFTNNSNNNASEKSEKK